MTTDTLVPQFTAEELAAKMDDVFDNLAKGDQNNVTINGLIQFLAPEKLARIHAQGDFPVIGAIMHAASRRVDDDVAALKRYVSTMIRLNATLPSDSYSFVATIEITCNRDALPPEQCSPESIQAYYTVAVQWQTALNLP